MWVRTMLMGFLLFLRGAESSRCSIDAPQRDIHRRYPSRAVFRALMARDQCLTVVGKRSGAARVLALPDPLAIPVRQGLGRHISEAVVEIAFVLPRFGIEADHLEAADADLSDTSVSGMHHEVTARDPLIYVARHNRHSGHVAVAHRLSLIDPAADQSVEPLELGGTPVLLCNVRCTDPGFLIAFHDVSFALG